VKALFDKVVARLLAAVMVLAAVPLVFVVVIKVFDGFESVFAAIGVFVVARFGWWWYRDGRW